MLFCLDLAVIPAPESMRLDRPDQAACLSNLLINVRRPRRLFVVSEHGRHVI